MYISAVTESVENLILGHLKRFQAGQDRIERDMKDIKLRLANLEVGHGALLQHLGHLSSAIAQQQVSMDRTGERIDRIERRLELTDG